MKRIRSLASRLAIYDVLSFGLMACLLVLALAYWHNYPVHMDTFYHMGVTSGFARAGGVALHSFWEFAPAGRAHLYPPLLHITMFTLTGSGLSTLSAGRVVSFSAFPLLMLSGWYGMRRLFSARSAFYATVLLSSCYLLFWHSAVESAAALVMILTPFIFVAVERNRKVAAAILLALALYSHLTLGHLVSLCLLIYALHRRDKFKDIFEILLGAYLLWLPWGIHILVNRAALSFSSPGASGITVHILIWVIALAGFVYCYFKKGRYYLLPSFLLGFIPIVFFYPDRFWNAHVFLPLAMLGGTALSALHGFLGERLGRLARSRAARTALVATAMAIPVALILLVDPVYSATGGTGGGPRMMARQQYSVAQPPAGAPARVNQISSTGETGQEAPPPGIAPPGVPRDGTGNIQPPSPPSGMTEAAGTPGEPMGVGGQGGQPGTNTPGGRAGMGGPGAPGGAGGPMLGSGFSSSRTTLLSLVGNSSGFGSQTVRQAAVSSDILDFATLIKANSTEEEILYVTDGSLGNLLTGLTGRSSTGGMFHEVSADRDGGVNGLESASLLVLSSGGSGMGGQTAAPGMGGPAARGTGQVDVSDYELVGTAGGYSLYRNTGVIAMAGDRGTFIPWYVVFPLLLLTLACILYDWFRPEKGTKGPTYTSLDAARHGGADGTGSAGGSLERTYYGSVLVIVPGYNEAESIGEVIRELGRAAPFADVLAVDDGSTDGTAAVALAAGATVISHWRNMGAGAAVRTGMCYALNHGYRYAVQVDADGQHDPSYIAALLWPLAYGITDVAVGSRFMGTGGYKPPLFRRVGTSLLSSVVSSITGQRTWDTTSGFRAMNRRALRVLVEQYPDSYAETESIILMHRSGIRWMEIPVAMRERAHGTSTISGLRSIGFMVNVLARSVLFSLGARPHGGPGEAARQESMTALSPSGAGRTANDI